MSSSQSKPDGLVPIKRALLSVSDKTGIIGFALSLQKMGIEILSTGGTAKTLREAGVLVKDVSEFTQFPEIMEGRVKTLHPKIHGGLLARRDAPDHVEAMKTNDIQEIDLVVINLYPFQETVNKGCDFSECIENIDIGGPAMIRASAKNHQFVTIITSPSDYACVLSELESSNCHVGLELRRKLALKAFSLTASYDSAISAWLSQQIHELLPERISFSGTIKQSLRYGENPHQRAALYLLDGNNRPGAARAQQLQGKELSYNNLNDTNAAFELVAEFSEPAVAIIKHANPCGVAVADDLLAAYKNALLCDPVSAFGGIIALNRPLTESLATAIIERFVEVIIAPSVTDEALSVLKKKENIRVLATGAMPSADRMERVVTRIAGGLLVQSADMTVVDSSSLKVVTQKAPSPQEMKDLLFAFTVCKHVKSNGIVYAKNGATVGIGAGQMSRIDSSRIAAWKAQEAAKMAELPISLAQGSVVASDAFFPFADGLIAAAEAGVSAVIQPGGSIRDPEVIKAADERGLSMVFTGMRHFRH